MTPSFCVISQEVPEEMRENLRQSFDDVIPLPPDDELAAPVACHPDMIFAVLDGCMFLSARYYARNTAGIDRIASLGGSPVFLPGKSMDRGAWWAAVHRVAKS